KIVTELAVVIFDEEDHQNRAESVNSLAAILEQDVDEEVKDIAIKAIEHALATYPHPCIADASSCALIENGEFKSLLDSVKMLTEQLKAEDYLATVGYSQDDAVEALENLEDRLKELIGDMSEPENLTEEYREKIKKFLKGHKNDLDRLLEQIKTQLEQLQPKK
ncbi:MAG: hypothetical protein HQ593_06010, partial [Candidatus Omnitrophica bacterium]|nr:hypothetical protein [Candidatus Omnitrophota bacterium]